jgi:hypothetical protein
MEKVMNRLTNIQKQEKIQYCIEFLVSKDAPLTEYNVRNVARLHQVNFIGITSRDIGSKISVAKSKIECC